MCSGTGENLEQANNIVPDEVLELQLSEMVAGKI